MHVEQLWRYPVKSLRGQRLLDATVGALGLLGDRGWALRERGSGTVLSAKKHPRLLDASAALEGLHPVVILPGGRLVDGDGDQADDELSAWLGLPVTLSAADPDRPAVARFPEEFDDPDAAEVSLTSPVGTFFDSSPVHLLTTAALRDQTTSQPELAWDARRFRPNLVIDVDGEGCPEDAWVGRRLRVGEVVLEVTTATGRCVVTTHAQPGDQAADLPVERDVLRGLRARRGGRLGVYARPVVEGSIRIGDPVELAG